MSRTFDLSPDGRWLVFAPWGDKHQGLFLFDLVAREVQTLTPPGIFAYHPAFTPDGKSVIYSRTQKLYDEQSALWRIDVASGEQAQLTSETRHFHGCPAVTPDGTRAYVGNLGTNTVSVINTATDTVTATITVGDDPEGVGITSDGRCVYVANGGDNTVSVVNAATSAVVATIAGVGPGPGGLGFFITPGAAPLACAGAAPPPPPVSLTQPIPTLNEWGLMFVVGLLAILGFRRLRRR